MKRPTITSLAIGCLLLALASPRAFAEPQGTTVKVRGEVVDLWCYLEGGDHGPDHKDCAVMCAKAGNPVGLLTPSGEIYVMMGMKDHQPGREVLVDKMAETVMVEGTLVKKGGLQVIYVSAVK